MENYGNHLKQFQQIQGNLQQNAKDMKALFTSTPDDSGQHIANTVGGVGSTMASFGMVYAGLEKAKTQAGILQAVKNVGQQALNESPAGQVMAKAKDLGQQAMNESPVNQAMSQAKNAISEVKSLGPAEMTQFTASPDLVPLPSKAASQSGGVSQISDSKPQELDLASTGGKQPSFEEILNNSIRPNNNTDTIGGPESDLKLPITDEMMSVFNSPKSGSSASPAVSSAGDTRVIGSEDNLRVGPVANASSADSGAIQPRATFKPAPAEDGISEGTKAATNASEQTSNTIGNFARDLVGGGGNVGDSAVETAIKTGSKAVEGAGSMIPGLGEGLELVGGLASLGVSIYDAVHKTPTPQTDTSALQSVKSVQIGGDFSHVSGTPTSGAEVA